MIRLTGPFSIEEFTVIFRVLTELKLKKRLNISSRREQQAHGVWILTYTGRLDLKDTGTLGLSRLERTAQAQTI